MVRGLVSKSKLCINIISYFGEDPILREKRKSYHEKQLDWAIAKGYDIYINAMCYEENEYRDHESITYIRNDRMDAGPARNLLLDRFYKSDDDVGLFLDNDTILYPYYDHETIFTLLEDDLKQFINKNVFCFNPAYPRIDPIHGPNGMEKVSGSLVQKDSVLAERLKTEMDFKLHYMLQTACMFIINPAKYAKGKTFFMDPNFIHKEDNDFGYQFMSSGLGVYKTYNIVMNELGMNNSVMLEGSNPALSEQQERKRRDIQAMLQLGSKWNEESSKTEPLNKANFKKRMSFTLGTGTTVIRKTPSDEGMFGW